VAERVVRMGLIEATQESDQRVHTAIFAARASPTTGLE
jgi:hypothetical protein